MSKSRVTNKEVLNEVKKINSKLELIGLDDEMHKEGKPENKEEGNSIKFLLAEFQHLRDIWKHTDARTENALRIYFTVATIIISAGAILYKQEIDFQYLLQVSLILLTALVFGSIFILRRITSTIYLKIEYFQSMNLIRQYFIDKDLEIKDYLLLPSNNKEEINYTEIKSSYQRKLKAPIILAFIFWISLLVGSLGVLVSYILTQNLEWNYSIIIISGMISFVVSFIFFGIQNKRIMESHMNHVLNRTQKKIKTEANKG